MPCRLQMITIGTIYHNVETAARFVTVKREKMMLLLDVKKAGWGNDLEYVIVNTDKALLGQIWA